MALQWFRSWHGAPTDTKWLAVSKRSGVPAGVISAIVWALLDHSSQHNDRGSIDGFDVEAYAVFSGFDEQQIMDVLEALEIKGVLTCKRFTSWEKRQPEREDTTATERKRRQRAKERDTEDVTVGHAQSREVTIDQIRPDQTRSDQTTIDKNPPPYPPSQAFQD